MVMRMLRPLLSTMLVFSLDSIFSFGGRPCNDAFLKYLGINDTEIVIGTSDVRNQSVYELMNIPRIGRRKRGTNPPAFYASTSYFEINEDQVVITSCLQVGETEFTDMVIEQNGHECTFSVNFYVVLTEPEIAISDSYAIVVSSSVGEVDVQEFTLVNENICTNFKCYVTCINEEKEFWIGNDTYMIRTSAVNIAFDFVYELNLICDDSDPEHGTHKTSIAYVEFSFIHSSSFTSGNYPSANSSFSPFTMTTTAVKSIATSALYSTSSSPVCLVIAIIVSLRSD